MLSNKESEKNLIALAKGFNLDPKDALADYADAKKKGRAEKITKLVTPVVWDAAANGYIAMKALGQLKRHHDPIKIKSTIMACIVQVLEDK